jgi:uncharacterized DUF497 family protein
VFTWTDEKNHLNKKKHGLYLSDIVDVFSDPHEERLYYDQYRKSTDSGRD